MPALDCKGLVIRDQRSESKGAPFHGNQFRPAKIKKSARNPLLETSNKSQSRSGLLPLIKDCSKQENTVGVVHMTPMSDLTSVRLLEPSESQVRPSKTMTSCHKTLYLK